MDISYILNKSNPVPQNREMSKSDYLKLVDRNTKLIDTLKELNNKYNIMKENAEYFAKENERLNNIINGIDEILKEHINECREELNMIMKCNDLDYINECSREFDIIRKNVELIMENIEELKGDDSNE